MNDFVAAIQGGELDLVRDMLSRTPDLVSMHHSGSFGGTGLIHAVLSDESAMVDLLLDAGADIDQRSDWWAGSFGVLDHARDEMAAHLLERGATLTPHGAARLGMIEELRAMIDEDPACVHQRGGDGQYPLHFARTTEIVDSLLGAGAEIDGRDIDHESTAAQWQATSRPTIAAHLVTQGCETDLFLAAATGSLDLLEDLVASDPESVEARVSRKRFSTAGKRAAEHIYFYTIGDRCSLLHAAAIANQARVIQWLLGEGADPNPRGGYDRQTPLHSAAWHNAPDAARALIEGGANMNAVSGNIHNNEPIGWAIVSGASEAFNLFLERGAAVKDGHRKDADRGAKGELRQSNRERPLGEWVKIRDRLLA